MTPAPGEGVGLWVAVGVFRVHATRRIATSTMTFATRPVTYRSLATRSQASWPADGPRRTIRALAGIVARSQIGARVRVHLPGGECARGLRRWADAAGREC